MGKRKGVFEKKWKKMSVIILIYFYSEYLTSFWKLNYIKQGRETVFVKGGHRFLKDESTALKKEQRKIRITWRKILNTIQCCTVPH